MKLTKPLLQAILVAVTVGTITSCEKETVKDGKKVPIVKPKQTVPEGCPGCGMG